MKKILIACIGLSMVASVVPAAGVTNDIDFVGTVGYYMPGDDDSYDTGYGAEVQARFWLQSNVGLALAVGWASWNVNGGEESMTEDGITASANLGGDIRLLPMGGSVLFRPVNNSQMALTIEAGVRYVIVDSQTDMEASASDSKGHSVYFNEGVDIGDGFVGVIGANIEGKISKKVSVLGGIGYQFDITKGDVEWIDEDLGDSALRAFIAKVGLVVKL